MCTEQPSLKVGILTTLADATHQYGSLVSAQYLAGRLHECVTTLVQHAFDLQDNGLLEVVVGGTPTAPQGGTSVWLVLTASGRELVHNPERYTGSTEVRTLAQYLRDERRAAPHTALQHPNAGVLAAGLQRLRTAIATDPGLQEWVKDDADAYVSVLEQELAKPEAEQVREKIQHRLDSLTALLDTSSRCTEALQALIGTLERC